jgi:nucleotide-binding universal stress UspA family protein
VSAVILSVLDHPAVAGALLRAAQRLAILCGATRISAMLVRAPPETMVSPNEEVLTAGREAALNDQEAARARKVQAAFEAWLPELPAGITSQWLDMDGIAELLVEEHGRRADFIVMERPTRREYTTSWHALRAALFATDRPILVVSRHCPVDFGRRVAIAWRDDERAAKAVLAAIRCLGRCEKVFVLAGVREGAAEPALPAILVEHGIAAELQVMTIGRGPFGAALLRKAHQLGADMLVMGAYQHSPLRELLLGGVTRHVLSHANLPVLLRH